MPLSQNLKQARKACGLTQAQVHERTGIGASSLSEFETGAREPSVSQLGKLASLYHVGVERLLSGTSLASPQVLWRERPAVKRKEIEARFTELCRWYYNLETWTGEDRTQALQHEEGEAARFHFRQAEGLAKRFRATYQLGDYPAHSLLSVLEEVCGVMVFHLDFEPTGTAACAHDSQFGSAILLNQNNSRRRRNFDLARELFHLLTWNIFPHRNGASGTTPEGEENLAQAFAVNLLLPEEEFRSTVEDRMHHGRIRREHLLDVARIFDVSVDCVAWRAHNLYAPDRSDTKRVRDVIARLRQPVADGKAWGGEATPPERPERYEALARKALDHGEISIGRFAQYMGISRRQAMRVAEEEMLDDEEIEIADP